MWCKNIYDVDLIFWKDIYEREREREMTIKPFFLEVHYNHHLRDGHSTSIKCLWSVGGRGRGLSLQVETSCTYTFRLG